MAVHPRISQAHMMRELETARSYAEDDGWKLEVIGDLQLRATITAPAQAGVCGEETYIFEFTFDNYREVPPLIDVVHPATGQRNVAACFPSGGKSYFHQGLRICAPWSRRAYAVLGGPHPEWQYGDWVTASKDQKELGAILALLRNLLRDSTYRGRGS